MLRCIYQIIAFVLVTSIFVACQPQKLFIKTEQTDPSLWSTTAAVNFTFTPIQAPNNINIVMRVDGQTAPQNFDLIVRTATLRDGRFFSDTINVHLAKTAVLHRSGPLKDIAVPYCQNANFLAKNSNITITIRPTSAIKGLHYVGLEVTGAKNQIH